MRNEAAKKRSEGETDGAEIEIEKRGEGEWKTAPLSAVSGPFVDRHAFEAAFAPRYLRNSWKLEFRLPENSPPHAVQVRKGENDGDATRRAAAAFPSSWTREPRSSSLAGWHHHHRPSPTTTTITPAPLALPFCKRADRRRQSVNRAHTWPIAVRYMHLYGVYPKMRASLVAKKRDGCCGRFRGVHHYRANVRGKLTIVESDSCKVRFESPAIISFVVSFRRGLTSKKL